MGKYTATIQKIIQPKLDKKVPRVQAFRSVRKANFRSIAEWEEHIDTILERFDNEPPGEYRSIIGSVESAITEERQFLRDLDELEESSWATNA